MRLSHCGLAIFATLPMLATASVLQERQATCSVGSILCCNSVVASNSTQASLLFGLLGIVQTTTAGLVGITCTPIVVGTGSGNSCGAQTVCCTDNSYGGVVALGCFPINLNP